MSVKTVTSNLEDCRLMARFLEKVAVLLREMDRILQEDIKSSEPCRTTSSDAALPESMDKLETENAAMPLATTSGSLYCASLGTERSRERTISI